MSDGLVTKDASKVVMHVHSFQEECKIFFLVELFNNVRSLSFLSTLSLSIVEAELKVVEDRKQIYSIESNYYHSAVNIV